MEVLEKTYYRFVGLQIVQLRIDGPALRLCASAYYALRYTVLFVSDTDPVTVQVSCMRNNLQLLDPVITEVAFCMSQ